jgi:hypothetical protein
MYASRSSIIRDAAKRVMLNVVILDRGVFHEVRVTQALIFFRIPILIVILFIFILYR